MMFPSKEWIAALVESVNRQPDLELGLLGLGRDAAFVVEAEPPALRTTFVVYGRHEKGRIHDFRLLPDVDDILELEPAYVLRAPYSAWKSVLCAADPMGAALTKVRVEGDLEALVRRSGYAHVVQAALRAVATEFP